MLSSRDEAGILLGEYLMGKESEDTIVIGIPRGGVVVALRVASMLHVPYDIVIVKKIPSPTNSELAIGAAGEGGEVYWDEEVGTEIPEWDKKEALKETLQLINQRKKFLRAFYPEQSIEGKDVILVDDGVATGATVLCAKTVLLGKGAKHISLATPVVAKDTYRQLRKEFHSVYALQIPLFFRSVGEFYESFSQVSDEEVETLLKRL